MIKDLVAQVVESHCPTTQYGPTWDLGEVTMVLNSLHPLGASEEELIENNYREDIIETLTEKLLSAWQQKKAQFPEDVVDDITKQISLRSIDQLWLDHIDEMTHLRDRVALSGYAQKDPIMEYKAESFRMFSGLLQAIRLTNISNLFRVQFKTTYSSKPLITAPLRRTKKISTLPLKTRPNTKSVPNRKRAANRSVVNNDELKPERRNSLDSKISVQLSMYEKVISFVSDLAIQSRYGRVRV